MRPTSTLWVSLTVHYLEPNLSCRNFALAHWRINGCHTFDVITEILKDILEEWGIVGKTVGMVTDNASNFVKALRLHGTPTAQEDEEPQDDEDTDDDGKNEMLVKC